MIAGHVPGAWLTLANYATAFTLCLIAAYRAPSASRIWTAMAAIMLALLANRAFGIDSLIAATARSLAKADGVYEGRRPYQLAAILVLVGLLPYGLRWAINRVERRNSALQLAVASLTCLVAFVAARALSFHYLDKLLALGPSLVKVNGLIENGVISGIAAGALLTLRRRSSALGRLQLGRIGN